MKILQFQQLSFHTQSVFWTHEIEYVRCADSGKQSVLWFVRSDQEGKQSKPQ